MHITILRAEARQANLSGKPATRASYLHCAVLGAGWEAFEHTAKQSAQVAKHFEAARQRQ